MCAATRSPNPQNKYSIALRLKDKWAKQNDSTCAMCKNLLSAVHILKYAKLLKDEAKVTLQGLPSSCVLVFV